MKTSYSFLALIIGLGIFCVESSIASLSLDELSGCYETISFNDEPVTYGSDAASNLTRIEKRGSAEFKDRNGNEIPSLSFHIFKEFELVDTPDSYFETYVFNFESIFLDRGTISYSADGLEFNFIGDLISIPWGSQQTVLNEKIQVLRLPNQNLEVQVDRINSIAGPTFDRHYTVVLKPTHCL